jgi:hypothetical protein
MATSQPAASPCPATRWSRDAMGAAFHPQRWHWTMSRSSRWRLLDAAARKPPRSVYWLNSHDPACAAKARDLTCLSVHALRCYEQGRLVLCADEKTGMQSLQRAYPTPPAQPGKPDKGEHASIRQGVRAWLASVGGPTGHLVWNLGRTRTRAAWAAHLANVVPQVPAMARYEWVVDTLKTHWSLEGCRLVAHWCEVPFIPKALHRGAQRRAVLSDPTQKPGFHCTPKHGSWRNQVE